MKTIEMKTEDAFTVTSSEILKMACLGYRALIFETTKRVEALEKVMEADTKEPPESPKGKMSPSGRKAIADAQKRRWAAKRAEKALAADQLGLGKTAARIREIGTSKPKRKLSAAGRKAIIAAQKKRWAKKAS